MLTWSVLGRIEVQISELETVSKHFEVILIDVVQLQYFIVIKNIKILKEQFISGNSFSISVLIFPSKEKL